MEKERLATPLEKDALGYLNELRLSAITNMFGAAPFVEAEFNVDRKESVRLLKLWMKNFNESGNYESVTDDWVE